MTKSEFQALFKQVKEKMHNSQLIFGGLNDETKEKLGLNEMDTIPINTISIEYSPIGAIKIDEKGYWEILDLHKTNYNNSKFCKELAKRFNFKVNNIFKGYNERIGLSEKLNKEIQKQINEQKMIRDRKYKIELEIQNKQIKSDESEDSLKKELNELNKKFRLEPSLIPLYPINIEMKEKGIISPRPNHFLKFENKTLFDICLKNRNGYETYHINETAKQWNKTVLEDYKEKGKESQKYKKYAEVFTEWFYDNHFNIDEVELLYDISERKDRKTTISRLPENIITEKYPNAKWEEVIICVPNQLTGASYNSSKIGIKHIKENNYTYISFSNFGFVRKNGNPSKFYKIISNHFFYHRDSDVELSPNQVYDIKKYVTEFRNKLISVTGVKEIPIPRKLRNENNYRINFRLKESEEDFIKSKRKINRLGREFMK